MTALSTDQQYEYLTACGASTSFVINRQAIPKAEFNRLAKDFLKWAPASPVWCRNWKACFGEEYIWRGLRAASAAAVTRITPPVKPLSSTEDPSRHSSSGSFSSEVVVSRALSQRSLSSSSIHSDASGLSRQTRPGGIELYFNDRYGTDYNKLEMWQKLCADVGVDEVPQSITKCKKALKKTYVNIYDFVDGHYHRFDSLAQLRKYTIKNHKVYPLAKAKQDTFHRALLHGLFFKKRKM